MFYKETNLICEYNPLYAQTVPDQLDTDNKARILRRFAKCFAKGFVKQITDKQKIEKKKKNIKKRRIAGV
jgi:hypothetical protein